MYQFLPDTPMGAATCIKRIADNAFIPFDPANTDYQKYLEWLAEGNLPILADAEEGNVPLPPEENLNGN
jgi:hypothetical protein